MESRVKRALSRSNLWLPTGELNRSSDSPLHLQIAGTIARGIRSGAIASNTRLPSTRLLAQLLGISRNTALAAYDELVADGLIAGERGSGMRVIATGAAGLRTMNQKTLLREAHYPERTVAFSDPDGNPMYVNF